MDAAGQAVQRLLADPTSRAVVVDFYGTWCGPCQSAVKKWAELQAEYGPRGLRLVVVSVESEGKVVPDGHKGDAWLPDVVVRDDDRSLMARWGVTGLPAAYLFTWKGGLQPQASMTGSTAGATIAKKLEAFYRESLKILVDAPIDGRDRKIRGSDGKGLRLAVQSVLLGQSRFDVVADDSALDRNIQLMIRQARRESKREKEQCRVDQMVPANARLVVRWSKGKRRRPGKLWLELLPLEHGCRSALVSSTVRQGMVQAAVPLAVQKLLAALGVGAKRPVPSGPVAAAPVAAAPVRPAAPVAGSPQVQLGAQTDFARLAAQAAEAEQREKAQKAARRKRLDEAIQSVKAQASRDYAAIERFVTRPTPQGKIVLGQFVKQYGDAKVTVDGVTETVEVPEVARVKAAMASGAGGPAPRGFVALEPGRFTMGSPSTEEGHQDDETQHPVEITRGFYLKAKEVTQGEWRSLMGTNPSHFSSCGDQCPVENVNWWEAVAYCNALSKREGLQECYTLTGCDGKRPGEDMECKEVEFVGLGCTGYRLPTEAEWEYAARAGTTGPFHTGECLSTGQANYDGNYPQEGCPKGEYREKPIAVGSFGANAWGLHDMAGNVWEWCWDWYGKLVPRTRSSRRDRHRPDLMRSSGHEHHGSPSAAPCHPGRRSV